MNRVVHFEIHATDLDKMQKFYESVFDWKISDMGPQMGNYRLIVTGEDKPGEKWPGINGGMVPRRTDLPAAMQAVNAYVCTVNIENIDASIEKVKNAGGSIALEKMNVPGVGDLAYIKDIEGNLLGILQPSTESGSAQ